MQNWSRTYDWHQSKIDSHILDIHASSSHDSNITFTCFLKHTSLKLPFLKRYDTARLIKIFILCLNVETEVVNHMSFIIYTVHSSMKNILIMKTKFYQTCFSYMKNLGNLWQTWKNTVNSGVNPARKVLLRTYFHN